MDFKRVMKRLTAAALGVILTATSVLPAFAAGEDEITPVYTYTSGEYTFEKISHPESPVETADGIVDYVGNGSITPYIAGETNGEGDRGQSYSYASAVYGDWVYINTMYGGLGVSSILGYGMAGMDAETAKAMMDVMYNGNLYMGEPDGAYAGGVLLKFNVKTGETVLLMSRDTNGLIPTFRNACEVDGKLYFVGMVVDLTRGLTQQEVATAIAMQNGFPCIYEIDPANGDKMTCIYDCVDIDGYRQLVADNVFTSTRAIGTYKDTLIAGCLDTEGVFLCASEDPSAGQESFKVIADMDDLFGYPAYHRTDVNGGGGIYQVIEYNDKLYVVICTGTPSNKNEETGTLQSFAIVRGECSGDATDRNAWTWTVLAGDEEDGARYPFGLDKERVSAGACTLEVYGDYLYIGDYNDVSSALQGFVLRKQFQTQATNLEQSVNLYRMDKDENIQKLVGDPTEAFPESLTGLGSGYETHMSQYTWQMAVYEGKLYVSTMDTTTLLEPIAQFTNGDLLNMSKEEWQRQINYIRVLLELLFSQEGTAEAGAAAYSLGDDALGDGAEQPADTEADDEAAETTADVEMTEEMAAALVDAAVQKAELRAEAAEAAYAAENSDDQAEEAIELTAEQRDSLINGLLDGSITEGQVDAEQMALLAQINVILSGLTALVDTTEIETFAETYSAMVEAYSSISDLIPENVKTLYNVLLSYATRDNLYALVKSLKYMRTSEAGFDLYEITDNGESVEVKTICTDGFGDRYNHGLRIFARTSDYWVIGTANPFYGTQLWRRENTVKDPTPVDPTPVDPTPVDPTPGQTDPSQPAGSTDGNAVAANTGTKTNAKTTGSTVKTGDTANPIVMAVIAVAALGAAGSTVWYRKKRS